MGQKKSIKQMAGFMVYVLGRRPDELGLVPDAEGFVKINALLQALGEESGWGFIRRSHLEEILAVFPKPVLELRENRVRAADREHLPKPEPVRSLPGQLFTCIRRRAYAHVLEKGLHASPPDRIILSESRPMAVRIGKRMDPHPILLTVAAHVALKQGAAFFKAGDSLYLADQIPAGSFSGPPLPKEKAVTPQRQDKAHDSRVSPGSFILDLSPKATAGTRARGSGKHDPFSWKRDRKRLRKEKEKFRLKGIPTPPSGEIGGED